MKRRIVSLLMCFVMMFGMLPTAAWAELIPAQGETEEAASNTAYAVGEDTAVQSGEDGIAVMAASANEAEYNGKEYATLAAAFKAAADAPGGTVTVLQDVTMPTDLTLTEQKGKGIEVTCEVTLDLNGFTVTKAEGEWENTYQNQNSWHSMFWVKGGNLTIEDSSEGTGAIVQLNSNPAVLVEKNGTLTVNGGTIKAESDGGENKTDSYRLVCAVDVANGTAYLNGGSFWGSMVGVNVLSKVYITGGTFHGDTSNALYVDSGNGAVLSGGKYTTGENVECSIYYAKENWTNVSAKDLLAGGYQYVDESGSASTLSTNSLGVVGNAEVVPAAGTVEYIGEGGAKQVCTDATELTGNNDKLNDEWYVVTGNVTIDGPLTIGAKTVNLILCDGATLTMDMLEVYVEQATLNVYLQKDGTGKLTTPLGVALLYKDRLTINRIGTPMKMVEIEDETTATDGRNGGFILSKCEHEGIVYSNSGDATKHEGTCDYCGTTVSGKHEFGDWKEEDAATHIAICKDCG